MRENKRIAKNTLFLYFRTAITMFIALYASRVILKQLGVSDYGVYNAIGGIVAMFSALSATLSGATLRYITFAIGKEDSTYLRKVFSASFAIHAFLAIVVVALAETVGIWYIKAKMNLPDGRLAAAMFVFQTSIASFAFDILTLPFHSAIIAYEKFNFFASVDIIRSVLRVILISCIGKFKVDALIVYSIIELVIVLIYKGSYVLYVKIKFKDCSINAKCERSLYKELISFTGWNFFGTASYVFYTQGGNLMLNYFYGVLLNAAMGVTTQVSNAVSSFVSSFSLAVNPQITKSYAANEFGRTTELIFFGSKIASYLLLLIGFPLVANIGYILDIWLVDVPDHSQMFITLAILGAFFGSFNNPFNNFMFATGNIKSYQLACVVINLASVFILYFCLSAGINPSVLYVLVIIQAILKMAIMLIISKRTIDFPVRDFLLNVYARSLLMIVFVLVVLCIKSVLPYKMTFGIFAVETVLYIVSMLVLLYFIGLRRSERLVVKQYISNRLHFGKIKKNNRIV